jgi:hypothetical protein
MGALAGSEASLSRGSAKKLPADHEGQGIRDAKDRIMRLNPYQRDALRLVIRDFHRPEGISPEVWTGLLFGEASEVRTSHLDVIAQMNPNLYAVLRFWRKQKG